jgi:hypothetical protein
MLCWVTPAGRARGLQCVKFLEELEREGMIRLPAVRVRHKRGMPAAVPAAAAVAAPGEITSCGEIRLVRPNSAAAGARWREYIGRHHPLGGSAWYGSQMRYFIVSGGTELGCMLFSAAAWAMAPRDEWIGWDADGRARRLHLVVNQSRYLIFPWVRVKNLASRALALAARQIQGDWLREYCYAPVLLETLVDASLYRGTCYRAANWRYLGETKGRGRNDRRHESALARKAIYAMPLQRDFRQVLQGEKAWKAVDPDAQ